MKSFLLTAATALLAFTANAQNFEVGINGGMSTTTKPAGALYQGDENEWTPAWDLNFHYNFHERWNVGLDVGLTSWKRTSQWPLVSTDNDTLGSQPVSFVLAQRAVTFAFQLNHVIPFYEQYEDFVRSHIYFGVSAGPVIIGNDAGVNTSRVNPNTPAEYTYISEYRFEPGYGFMTGVQVGFTYYLGEHMGLNVEFAPKISWMETNESRLGRQNRVFNVMYFPTTIGFHYRFGY